MRDEPGRTIYLSDYKPLPFGLPETELHVDISARRTRIRARLTIEPTSAATGQALRLDGEELELKSIAIDGVPLAQDEYEADGSGLTVYAPPPRRFVLETEVDLKPADNQRLMGLYVSNGVWCTQCEPEGFRRITYFFDRPDVLSRFRVRMTAPKNLAPVLLANGNPVEHGDLPKGAHFAVWEDPFPKPSYLFAMVAGDLGVLSDNFTTASGRAVKLAIYSEHGKEDQCAYAMDALKRSMAWDERRFGREYDLEVFNIVAVSDFNFGAMENKGLNIFNDRFVLARPELATDADYANIERIIAHEYFHNWTGNRITCRDWFQLCLKEGLTVYRDQEFTSDERSRAVKRIEDVRTLRSAQFPEDNGPLAHPARPDRYREINNFYTATVYEKGAEIVRMLATLLGDEGFRGGTDLYFDRHDGEATTIEAWLKVFEDASGRDLGHFGKWYEQAGTPEVTVAERWDAAAHSYTLTLSQRTPPTPGQDEKLPMVLPVKFGLVGPNGQDMHWESVEGGSVSGDMIILDKATTQITFRGISNRPVPSLFRGFSAPVKVRSEASMDDQLFLARHDSDAFNRWQALQDVGTALMLRAGHAGGAFEDEGAVGRLADALAETLASTSLDEALKAQGLTLPGEAAILQALARDVDPQRVHEVRRDLARRLSQRLRSDLYTTYERLEAATRPYSAAAEPTRARALRNQCLALIVAGGGSEARGVAETHYLRADNMTDRFAALAALVAAGGDAAEMLLADFRINYADDPLVLDKWLALNALLPDERSLARIRDILAEPGFPKTNPNRLRALVGTFAMGNVPQFARADGEGFRFVAQFCRDADGTNPQVAARILTAFRIWPMLEPGRREAGRAALEWLAGADKLSRNLSDILTRMLAE